VKYCKNALNQLDTFKNARRNAEDSVRLLKRTSTLGDGLYICRCCVKKLIKKNDHEGQDLYFNQLRTLTELYYIIEEYIDTVVENCVSESEKQSYMRLIKVVYKKSQELQRELSVPAYKLSTYELKEIFKTSFRQLFATEKLVAKYILKEELYYRPQRIRKQVNYKV
jgi:hypothetical protein